MNALKMYGQTIPQRKISCGMRMNTDRHCRSQRKNAGCNLEKDVIKQKLLAIRQRNMMFFDTDDEFADFVIHPYAVINNYEGRLSYEGAYSEQYLRALKEGKSSLL